MTAEGKRPEASGDAKPRGEPAAGREAAGRGNTIAVSGPDAALLRLGMLLQLERRARLAQADELPFIIANETRQLIPYRQAAFWTVRGGKPRLAALSGLPNIETNSPYTMWLGRFVVWLAARLKAGKSGITGQEALSATAVLAAGTSDDPRPDWLADWREWLPEHALSVPLYGPGGWLCGWLCLFRENAFPEQEAKLFSYLAESYGQTLGAAAMRPRRLTAGFGWWRAACIVLALLALAAMFVPRPQFILAPAEVTARRPAVIRAGVEGVVDRILVEPNQRVAKGEALLRLEDTQLRTRLAVARKAEEMARAEMQQLQQLALSDPKSKARLPMAVGRVEQLASETEYIQSLLGRVVATSPIDGLVIVDNPSDWEGRPVGLGQKIMTVADPDDVELEINVPAAEAMNAKPGDELLFFTNIAPASPLGARLVFVGYRAGETPGVGMAFRLRAEFADPDRPMLGLRGTARLQGRTMPLGLIILRRPINTVRQWLGL